MDITKENIKVAFLAQEAFLAVSIIYEKRL
jgi:hypothetical protein